MMKLQSSPIELLMEEHQLILRAIASLETFVELYGQGDSTARQEDLGSFVRFIRSFSDAHHHGKEEDILFKKMTENGFPLEQGPVAVMLSEHDEGRTLVRGLAEVAAKAPAQVTDSDRHQVKESGLSYANLLRQHIRKEDGILYPMARNFLSQQVQAEMEDEFVRFESAPERKAEVAALIGISNELITRYPGKELEDDEMENKCFGCGLH